MCVRACVCVRESEGQEGGTLEKIIQRRDFQRHGTIVPYLFCICSRTLGLFTKLWLCYSTSLFVVATRR